MKDALKLGASIKSIADKYGASMYKVRRIIDEEYKDKF